MSIQTEQKPLEHERSAGALHFCKKRVNGGECCLNNCVNIEWNYWYLCIFTIPCSAKDQDRRRKGGAEGTAAPRLSRFWGPVPSTGLVLNKRFVTFERVSLYAFFGASPKKIWVLQNFPLYRKYEFNNSPLLQTPMRLEPSPLPDAVEIYRRVLSPRVYR